MNRSLFFLLSAVVCLANAGISSAQFIPIKQFPLTQPPPIKFNPIPPPSGYTALVAAPEDIIDEFCNLVMNSLEFIQDPALVTPSEANAEILRRQQMEDARCKYAMMSRSRVIWDDMGLAGQEGRYGVTGLETAIQNGVVFASATHLSECIDFIRDYPHRVQALRTALGDMRMSIGDDSDRFAINYDNAGAFFAGDTPCSDVFWGRPN